MSTTHELPLEAEVPPLRFDEGGAARIGKSRVSLDVVIEQYENGMSAEDLLRAYDSLSLADIHAVISYYLRHRDEVRSYLKRREQESLALRTKIEAERSSASRDDLLARRGASEEADAPAGQ